MKLSNLFFASKKFDANVSAIELAQRTHFLYQDSAGVFSLGQLSWLMMRQLQELCRTHLSLIGCYEMSMSTLQNSAMWQQSKRQELYGKELFTTTSRNRSQLILGATGEEYATCIAKSIFNLKGNIDCSFFQISNKFRDEMRVFNGLVRAREFLMCDAYSFHSSKEKAKLRYEEFKGCYERILTDLQVSYSIKEALNEQMGGSYSQEFVAQCAQENISNLEVAHIFKLDTHYSKIFDFKSQDSVHMNSYGIGLSRLFMLLLANQKDSRGFFGRKNFKCFDILVSDLNFQDKAVSERIYSQLKKNYAFKQNVCIALDDRQLSVASKLYDSELMAIRYRVSISSKSNEAVGFEILDRESMQVTQVASESEIYRFFDTLDL